jgi:hypothetical protein
LLHPKSGLSWSVNHLLTIIIDDVTMVGLIADFLSILDCTNASMSCPYTEKQDVMVESAIADVW